MTAPSYHLVQITDLLQVPIERREVCVREILLCLALGELTGLEPMAGVHWTDDGDKSVYVDNEAGERFLTLAVAPLSPGEHGRAA